MHDRTYTFRDLIQAYIATWRHYPHSDFDAYYRRLLEVLQSLFDVRFDGTDVRGELLPGIYPMAALMVFRSTVDSYLAIRTPWSGYLEAGLGVAELAKRYSLVFDDLAERNRQAHLELLDTLFIMLYGSIERIFTSADLREAGFDDSTEPNTADYWDYV